MYIFIMRHGEADHQVTIDRERKLTDNGRVECQQAGQWLLQYCQQHGTDLQRAIVSPYRRAQESYFEMGEELNIGQFDISNDIVPSGNASVTHDYLDVCLKGQPETDGVLLVSHMPFVSYLLDNLCADHHSMLFTTGAIAVVDYDAASGKGRLVEQFMPE